MSRVIQIPKGAAIKLEWRSISDKYSNGEDLWMGQVRAGSVFWDAAAPKGTEAKWTPAGSLPGMGGHHERSVLKEDAKERLENSVILWLKKVGLLGE